MEQIIRIGMDTSKHIFQLHGVDAAEQPVLRKQLRRKEVVSFFAKLPPTVVGMEACGASHYWARELGKLGHEVRLIAPQHVKPYVMRNKNDGRDAFACAETTCWWSCAPSLNASLLPYIQTKTLPPCASGFPRCLR